MGERQTEDLKVPGSIPGLGSFKKTMILDIPCINHILSTKIKETHVIVEISYVLPFDEKWRIRVSIPVPLECKSSALPLELIPLAWK